MILVGLAVESMWLLLFIFPVRCDLVDNLRYGLAPYTEDVRCLSGMCGVGSGVARVTGDVKLF